MKKIFIILLVALVALPVCAQNKQRRAPQAKQQMASPYDRAYWQTQSLDKMLQLDSLQFQAIFLMNYSDAMAEDSLRAKPRANGERKKFTEEEMKTRREAMKKRFEVREEQMKIILNEEQYKKYTDEREKRRKEMRPQNRGPRGGAGRPQFPGGDLPFPGDEE